MDRRMELRIIKNLAEEKPLTERQVEYVQMHFVASYKNGCDICTFNLLNALGIFDEEGES